MKHLRDLRQRLTQSEEPYFVCLFVQSGLVHIAQLVMPRHCINYRAEYWHQPSTLWEEMMNTTAKWVFDWLSCRKQGKLHWRQVAKWSHPQSATMWRFTALFTTKCFFVQFQWSCNSVISRRIGSEDPGGQLVSKTRCTDDPISLDGYLFFCKAEVLNLLLKTVMAL